MEIKEEYIYATIYVKALGGNISVTYENIELLYKYAPYTLRNDDSNNTGNSEQGSFNTKRKGKRK